jgi:hypothetical protein
MAQHKWHKEIKAWADGAEIETCKAGVWFENDYPQWHSSDYQFRIKPQPKEPQYLYVFKSLSGNFSCRTERNAFEYIGEYLGKIKLENDDGN